jgi:hypothetical protein
MDGQRLPEHGLDGDEVRYHDHSGTVLVRKNETLVTVIDIHGATERLRAAVLGLEGEQ